MKARFRGPFVAQTAIGRLAQPGGAEAAHGRKAPANEAVPRRSSSSVVVPDSACHARARGFESRRSRRGALGRSARVAGHTRLPGRETTPEHLARARRVEDRGVAAAVELRGPAAVPPCVLPRRDEEAGRSGHLPVEVARIEPRVLLGLALRELGRKCPKLSDSGSLPMFSATRSRTWPEGDDPRPRAVIVRRRTEPEELLERHGTRGQAGFFLAARGRSLDEVEARQAAVEAALAAASAEIRLRGTLHVRTHLVGEALRLSHAGADGTRRRRATHGDDSRTIAGIAARRGRSRPHLLSRRSPAPGRRLGHCWAAASGGRVRIGRLDELAGGCDPSLMELVAVRLHDRTGDDRGLVRRMARATLA
jgi:hypothetical protein